MTFDLVQLLKEEYPPINNFDRVNIYGAYERIYLNLIDKEFVNAPIFSDKEKIDNIAKKIFDVPYEFISKGDVGEAIFFDPIINDKYHQNHFAHHIQIHLPSRYPLITLSTANRGEGELFEKQRDNYFNFIKDVYSLFLANAKQ